MNKNKILPLVIVLSFFLFFAITFSVMAKSTEYGLGVTTMSGNLPKVFTPSDDATGSIVSRVSGIVGFLLSFIGLVFLILIIYSGVLWMTASGNEQQIQKSKNIMIWSIIGIISIFASFAIVQFIGNQSTRKVFQDENSTSTANVALPETDNNQAERDAEMEKWRNDVLNFRIKQCAEEERNFPAAQEYCQCALDDEYYKNNIEQCLAISCYKGKSEECYIYCSCLYSGGDGCKQIFSELDSKCR
ncbi:MAG TPA: hypothetical protein PK686_03520 [bacterium]|nr:hypothetical protein [bacterium]HPV65715.1 hypothetical protein [bacterium]